MESEFSRTKGLASCSVDKTVIRGGYSMIFDRQNTVQSVIVPTLGVAFAQTINVTCRSATRPALADGMHSPGNTAANGFRVGVDGRIPIPTVPTLYSCLTLLGSLRPTRADRRYSSRRSSLPG